MNLSDLPPAGGLTEVPAACATCPNAVSYTHLTLPTIYSV